MEVRKREELESYQRGGLLVVCQLEKAQWVPYPILMEAKKISLTMLT